MLCGGAVFGRPLCRALSSDDLYGGVVAVNFRNMLYKAAFRRDFHTWQPVGAEEQLDDLAWLDTP